MKTGHRQWKLRSCLPGKVVRDQWDGCYQEGSAGQEVQEPRASNNAETGALQYCQVDVLLLH